MTIRCLLASLTVFLSGLSFSAQAQTVNPFQPAGVITGNGSSIYRLTAGTSSTPFQLPALGIQSGRIQVSINNEGSQVICVAFGQTQASVNTLIVPSLGSGTIGAAGNCRTINPGNNPIYSTWDGAWYNIQTLTGSSNVAIEAGTGN